jgi:hypothetical protein
VRRQLIEEAQHHGVAIERGQREDRVDHTPPHLLARAQLGDQRQRFRARGRGRALFPAPRAALLWQATIDANLDMPVPVELFALERLPPAFRARVQAEGEHLA